MPAGNYTKRIDITSTATGASSYVDWGNAMGHLSAAHVLSGSTKAVTFVLQGSIGVSDIWHTLSAATTGSTAGAVMSSTVAMTFDKARIRVLANATTGNGTLTAHLQARW